MLSPVRDRTGPTSRRVTKRGPVSMSPLLERLLVDRKFHAPGVERVEHLGREVEGRELHLRGEDRLAQRLDGRLGSSGPEGQHAVGPSLLGRSGDPSLRGGGVLEVDVDDARASSGAAQAVGESGAARRERRVVALVLDAQRAPYTGPRHPPPGGEAGAAVGLTDMCEHLQPARDLRAGVDRHHGNATADRGPDRAPERPGVRDRDHEPVGARPDRFEDQRPHARHVGGVSRPACRSPAFTTAQNGSEAWPCVTTATLSRPLLRPRSPR